MQGKPIKYKVRKRTDKKDNVFYVFWTENGRWRKRSTGITDPKLAKALENKLNAEEVERHIFGRAAVEEQVSFAYAALQYLDAADDETGREARKRFMTKAIEILGDTPIKNIDDDEMRKASRLAYPTASSATLRRQFYTPVMAVLHWGSRRPRCWCPNPVDIDRPKDSKPRTRFLWPREAHAIAEATTNIYARAAVEFLLSTGARESEAIQLDWNNLSLETGEAWLNETKTGEPRRIEFGQRARNALANLPERTGPVIRNQYGTPYKRTKGKGGRLNEMLRGACARAGVDRITAHELRITWATWHYARDQRAELTADRGGWRGKNGEISQTLWRYVKLAPRNFKPQLDAFGFDFAIDTLETGDQSENRPKTALHKIQD